MIDDYKDNQDVILNKFPTLLTEPWRVQEFIAEETSFQRFKLFRIITWTRFIVSFGTFLILLGSESSFLSIFIAALYPTLMVLLLIESKKENNDICHYSIFSALLDSLALSYIILISDTRTELSFIFFSILMSSMILPFFRLILIILLSSLIIVVGWTKENFMELSHFQSIKEFSFQYTHFEKIFTPERIEEMLILIIGLFTISILTNRLTNWSFTNEVRARFRYKQVRQVLSFNHSVIEHLKSGILVLTTDSKVISINQRAIELLNLNDSQAVITLSDLSQTLFNKYRHWLSTSDDGTNFTYRHNQGASEVFVSFSSFGKAEQNKIIMMTLESVNEAIQQTQEAKLTALGRLTAGVAHEIRNPLSSINSAAQLLNESDMTPAQTKLSQMIVNNVKRTDQIINDILGLFKDTVANRKLIPIQQTLRKFCTEFTITNKDNHFKIRINSNIKDPLFLMFDEGQLNQILWNLAQNSLKYANTEELVITLQYKLSANRKLVYIYICDNGQGIDPEKATQIFEPFYTGGASGSGLGLYLVRELCSANNAHITYAEKEQRTSSQDQTGACFRLVAPVYFSNNIKPKIN
ncbi:MAG: hypothetical protein KGV50_01560 [Gammaproteobacteria bacterium]|nr:hypothetical protein [Gammaproteobacteria bacterium]